MTDAEEIVRKEINQVWHLFQYGDEDMLRALNALNPDFGDAVISAATRAARTYARQIAEACAQLADDAICPRAAATQIRARYDLSRVPDVTVSEVAVHLALGHRWCPECRAWRPAWHGANPLTARRL